MSSYLDFGYNGFLERPLVGGNKYSPKEVSALFPSGSFDSSGIGTYSTFSTNIVFSSTDNDTAAWAEGTISFSDGTATETIVAGNTGNMAALTFIYYDGAQKGALQTTTSASTAVGKDRVLLALAENVAGAGKSCKITPLFAKGLVVSEIAANQITAGTITANEISGNQLDVVAANTGTLNVDEYITLGSDANVKIDGANKRIVINDGSDNRVLVGYGLGLF